MSHYICQIKSITSKILICFANSCRIFHFRNKSKLQLGHPILNGYTVELGSSENLYSKIPEFRNQFYHKSLARQWTTLLKWNFKKFTNSRFDCSFVWSLRCFGVICQDNRIKGRKFIYWKPVLWGLLSVSFLVLIMWALELISWSCLLCYLVESLYEYTCGIIRSLFLTYTANFFAVNPTAFHCVPIQDVIQM